MWFFVIKKFCICKESKALKKIGTDFDFMLFWVKNKSCSCWTKNLLFSTFWYLFWTKNVHLHWEGWFMKENWKKVDFLLFCGKIKFYKCRKKICCFWLFESCFEPKLFICIGKSEFWKKIGKKLILCCSAEKSSVKL